MKFRSIIFAALLGVGCTAESYRRSADRQVQGLVHEREQQTLGYRPEAEASLNVDQKPRREAFAKIPLTPRTPPTTAPIVTSDELPLPAEKLGPHNLLPPGLEIPTEDTEADTLIEAGRGGLKLGPPGLGSDVMRLDLFTSIAYAVQHSREYRGQMEDLYLSALDVTLQRHLFEPRPFAQTGLRVAGGQENVNYQSALTITNSVGVRQQLPYGGEITARALVDFVDAINGNAANGESAALVVSASIPLLRGAGMVNLEPLISGERELIYAVRDFEQFRRDFAVNVASDYFRLLARQQRVTDRRQNLESRRALTQRTRALYAAGRMNYLEVQRALQEQLSAQNDLVDTEADYQSELDNFKLLLGMPVEQPLNIVQRELDVSIPEHSAQDAVQMARRFRLDLRTLSDRIEDARRRVDLARNGLLPDLDLTVQGEVRNPSDTPARNLNNDTSAYSAGVQLDLPLDRVAERNAYRRSLIQLERAQRSYSRLNDLVAIQARDALRSIRSAQITVDIQRRGIELARLRLENATELLRQGKRSDNRDVVEAQNSLLRAQDQFEQARANLQIQVLRFLRDTGMLRVDPDAGELGLAMERTVAAKSGDAGGISQDNRR